MRRIIFILFFAIAHCTFIIEDSVCQWVQMSNGIGNDEHVYALTSSGNKIFAGTSDSGIYLSTNYGQEWSQTALNNETVYSLAISGNNIFAGTFACGVYLSSNNGQNWTQTTLNDKIVYSLAIDGNNIFAGTDYYGVWLSSNNGQNWTQIGLNYATVESIAINGMNIFVGTENSGVWLSTNYGQNWTQTALNNKSVFSLAISGIYIFAGTMQYGVYLSTNNGQNWTQTSLNNYSVNYLLVSGYNIFAGVHGFYLSTNNGQNWTQKNEGFNSVPGVEALLTTNNYIFAGTFGHSIWRRPLSDFVGIKNISSEIPSAFALEQNYPNPFNAVTSIKFKVTSERGRSQKTEVRLKVFDLMGREVRTLVDERLEAGVYEVRFDSGDLPSGVYFYRMEAGSYLETKRMILIK